MYHFLLPLPARVPGHPAFHRGTWTADNPSKTSPGAQRHPSPGQEEAEMGGAPSISLPLVRYPLTGEKDGFR